ncbi:hypothetical protein YN1_8830 [Nanoarchaeota archaeon]
MKELLHLDQHPEFPNKFYGIIINTPGTNCINIIDYDEETNCILNYKVSFPFYFGFIPQTYLDDYPVFFVFFSDKKFDLYTKLELEPILFFKVPKENVINIVYSKLYNYELEIKKENIDNIFKEFFELENVVKVAKADSFLENANNNYHKKFIKLHKKS